MESKITNLNWNMTYKGHSYGINIPEIEARDLKDLKKIVKKFAKNIIMTVETLNETI